MTTSLLAIHFHYYLPRLPMGSCLFLFLYTSFSLFFHSHSIFDVVRLYESFFVLEIANFITSILALISLRNFLSEFMTVSRKLYQSACLGVSPLTYRLLSACLSLCRPVFLDDDHVTFSCCFLQILKYAVSNKLSTVVYNTIFLNTPVKRIMISYLPKYLLLLNGKGGLCGPLHIT